MRIRDFDNPESFQRFCSALFVAEHGLDFEAIDDSGGDGGNDGYLRSSKSLVAIYCPEKKPTKEQYERKIHADLDKAVRLRDERGYEIEIWAFVTPSDLREPLHSFIRDEAAAHGFVGISIGDTHLKDYYLRHPHLHDQFPDLAQPAVSEQLAALTAIVHQLIITHKEPEKDAVEALQRSEEPRQSQSEALYAPVFSKDLIRVQEMLRSGHVEEGLALLTQVRVESANAKEKLWCYVLDVQNRDKIHDGDTVIMLAEQGLSLAQSLDDKPAEILLSGELAWLLNWRYTELDMRTFFTLQVENMSGVYVTSDPCRQDIVSQLKQLRSRWESLFHNALQMAIEHKLAGELCVLLQRIANAAFHRYFFRINIPVEYSEAAKDLTVFRTGYEGAITLANAIDDAHLMATAYHNYANSLRWVRDIESARRFARRAKELVDVNNLTDIKVSVESLVTLLDCDNAADIHLPSHLRKHGRDSQ